jgi:hypothetical protein
LPISNYKDRRLFANEQAMGDLLPIAGEMGWGAALCFVWESNPHSRNNPLPVSLIGSLSRILLAAAWEDGCNHRRNGWLSALNLFTIKRFGNKIWFY